MFPSAIALQIGIDGSQQCCEKWLYETANKPLTEQMIIQSTDAYTVTSVI